jgi:cell wall-associated NlpC family hydrolase
LTVAAVLAPGALASNPGGVSAITPAAPTKAKKPLHTAPVTAKTPNLAYTGPVYERTATGAVVPYVPVVVATKQASAATAGTGGAEPATSTTTTTTTTTTPAASETASGPTARPELLVPGTTARYVNGLAAAPISVPLAVQEIIWAGNEIIGLPYIYGGGHASFTSAGYDCSGTVSFALHGASLLESPEDSSEFMAWGSHGVGRWVAIFSNPEHAYMTVAGLRLDTSSADDPSNQQGPRWRPLRPANSGYTVRHPLGL